MLQTAADGTQDIPNKQVSTSAHGHASVRIVQMHTHTRFLWRVVG